MTYKVQHIYVLQKDTFPTFILVIGLEMIMVWVNIDPFTTIITSESRTFPVLQSYDITKT